VGEAMSSSSVNGVSSMIGRLDLDLRDSGSAEGFSSGSEGESGLLSLDNVVDDLQLCDVLPKAKMKLSELYCTWASAEDSRKLVDVVVENEDIKKEQTSSPGFHHVPRGQIRSPTIEATVSSTCRPIPKSPVAKLIRSTVVFPSSPTIGAVQGAPNRGKKASPLVGEPLVLKTLSDSPPPFILLDSDLEQSLPERSPSPLKRKTQLPQFYFPNGEVSGDTEAAERRAMKIVFDGCDYRSDSEALVGEEEVRTLMNEVVGLPSFLAEVVFEGCHAWRPTDSPRESLVIDAKAFRKMYDDSLAGFPTYRRLFHLLRFNKYETFLRREHLQRVVDLVLVQHTGLNFLESTPQFQVRYLETVLERIFYKCAKRNPNRLYPKELEQGGLLEAMRKIDTDEDINSERDFFSYEHFYVLFCRFWEIDTDHDMHVDSEDLLSYGGHALSCRIVERIFAGVARPIADPANSVMSYTDFVWFCLSEEDKTSERALEYWFQCIDLDGDGIITLFDMEYFYEEQIHRMECLGHEPITFVNVVNQLLDMLEPWSSTVIITKDVLRRSKQQSAFFNVLFNINKLFALEGKDLRTIRQVRETPDLTDWDRFALFEYHRLSAEEEETETVDSIVF